ncbi:CoA-transferase family III [Podospora appendiculata]|uniref:CoA-transferase family III n=1 Tax=Podospora appendiculata TaxID=314037 RepID=A0AAE0XG10_9PEZI|nr:CoA-transferase family III [Podospora appendiculata]
MDVKHDSWVFPHSAPYSVIDGASDALRALLTTCQKELPGAIFRHVHDVVFTTTSPNGDVVHFPTPLREQDVAVAIKALEACMIAAIANLQHGVRGRKSIEVDLDRTSCFLMSAYLCTIDGMDKANPKAKSRIPDTDLNEAQSVLYRRLSANLYETKNPGEFYHIHGSLNASETLKMIGLPPYDPKMVGYRDCINTIEKAVRNFTVAELEKKNQRYRQAGIPALTWKGFRGTSHGKTLLSLPPLTVRPMETSTPCVPFDPSGSRSALRGIKVLEMCRVIAGPTIGRSLAAHGASVLKVTSPNLPDVPFFQVDVNTGKHATALDLRNSAADRAVFEALLADADVIIDGYRPGALARLGYSPEVLSDLAQRRGRGFVYVVEDCFGGTGVPGAEWAGRPGWQQIADCVTGVAWAQGKFMGLAEPVVPPFPMSDYGTGALGAVAAMAGLYRRATQGGSWICRTSLCQYDVFVMSLGPLPAEEQERLRQVHDADFFGLRHSDSVDEVGRRALLSMKRVAPHLFKDEMMHTAWSTGFGADLTWPREAIRVSGLRIGHVRAARPNGFDAPGWEDWEEDEEITLCVDGDGDEVGPMLLACS